jgi:methyl-accepting chemotaxis protein
VPEHPQLAVGPPALVARRTLAEQSKVATTEVRTILLETQRATAKVVMATEEGAKRSDASRQLIDCAGQPSMISRVR